MSQESVRMVFEILMLLGVGGFVFFMMKYLRDFKVFSAIRAKLKGDIFEYDRVKREQMKNAFESSQDLLSEKKDEPIPFVSRLYKRVSMTGITTKFPAFSESLFLFLLLLADAVLFSVLALVSNAVVGGVAFAASLFLEWYILGLIGYARKSSVESQLLQFTNSCASASRQYSSIVDIIGAVYDQFEGHFRDALQALYVEAKTTSNQEEAFNHLKAKYDSSQLAFVLDNLVTCSEITGDYYASATDLSRMVSIFTVSHEKKKVTLRNAKVNITVMFVIAGLIVYAMGSFFEAGLDPILKTTIGNVLLVVLGAVYVFGMSMKAD